MKIHVTATCGDDMYIVSTHERLRDAVRSRDNTKHSNASIAWECMRCRNILDYHEHSSCPCGMSRRGK